MALGKVWKFLPVPNGFREAVDGLILIGTILVKTCFMQFLEIISFIAIFMIGKLS
jgi:hypothetical protein